MAAVYVSVVLRNQVPQLTNIQGYNRRVAEDEGRGVRLLTLVHRQPENSYVEVTQGYNRRVAKDDGRGVSVLDIDPRCPAG